MTGTTHAAGAIAASAFLLPSLGFALGPIFEQHEQRWQAVGPPDDFPDDNYVPKTITLVEGLPERLLGDKGEEDLLQRRAGLAGLLAKLLDGALGDQPAPGDDADAFGEPLGDLQYVRRHDYGTAGSGARLEHVLDLARRYGPARMDLLVHSGLSNLPAALDKPPRPGVNAWVCRGVECLAPIDALPRLTEVLRAAS